MKRIISAVLVLMMLMACACAESSYFSGTWYLNEMTEGDITLNPASFGLEMTLQLNDDGTAEIAMTGEENVSASWSYDASSVTVEIPDADALVFTFEGGNLCVDDSGSLMVFGREKAEAETLEIGELLSNATTADFNGDWTATVIELGGMQLPIEAAAELMGESISLKIEDGKIEMVTLVGEETASEVMEGEAVDGAIEIADENGIAGGRFNLYDSGILSLTIGIGEESIIIYFKKA